MSVFFVGLLVIEMWFGPLNPKVMGQMKHLDEWGTSILPSHIAFTENRDSEHVINETLNFFCWFLKQYMYRNTFLML